MPAKKALSGYKGRNSKAKSYNPKKKATLVQPSFRTGGPLLPPKKKTASKGTTRRRKMS